MPATTHTPKIVPLWTNIVTAGVDRDVIALTTDSLTVFYAFQIDLTLWDNPANEFYVNHQITEASRGQRFDNLWGPNPMSALPKFPALWVSMSWNSAAQAGVTNGMITVFSAPTDSMYLYRPYIAVIVPGLVGGEILVGEGKSEFAVADEHFFFCEENPN
jgi:hypothetical protein